MTHILRALAIAGLIGAAAPLQAHELIVVLGAAEDGAGPFRVESTHVMIAPEEAEDPQNVTARLVPVGGDPVALPLTVENGGLAGAVAAPEGPAWMTAHRHGMVWSNTPTGWKPGGRDANPDAATAKRYEKFAKAMLPSAGWTVEAATAPLGHGLEIQPLVDPSQLAAGDALPVRVLHDGAPIPALVQVVRARGVNLDDGFDAEIQAEADDAQGFLARPVLDAPGLWVIRAQHEAPDAEAGVDSHVLRAVLTVSVQ